VLQDPDAMMSRRLL